MDMLDFCYLRRPGNISFVNAFMASEDYCISSAIDFPVLDLILLSKCSIHFSDKNKFLVHHTWSGFSVTLQSICG